MARNKTIFLYNDSKKEQDWTIYSEGVINQSYKVSSVRRSFTISVSGDVEIHFGVDGTVYLKAKYTYASDSWTSHTDTPNEISFLESQDAISVTSSYTPE